MALFSRLLLLAVFMSVTTHYGAAVIQTSDRFTECKVPDNYSSIDRVHTNLTEGEFGLLHIEGNCFLFCTTDPKTYSSEIGESNYSLSSYWPFVSINQSDCITTLKVHECTRGCLYRHRSTIGDQCVNTCIGTCHSVLELQNCDPLFECHPWIPVHGNECQGTCDQLLPYLSSHHPCLIGCSTGNLQNGHCCSAPPHYPIGPPLLILDHNTTEQLKFIVDLSGAAPPAQKCEPISTSVDILPVAFLFKFVEINSGNVSYKWIANPFEHLDLIEYACQELKVSFAVSNRAGISNFSMATSMIINGDEQLTPVPPTGLQISEEIDKRVGFFGHVILNISWDTPQLQNNTCHEDCFQVTLTTAAGFDTLKCGCRPWIRRVPDNTFLVIEAESMEALPVMSCSYDIQIHSIGRYGASHPLQETYIINTEFDAKIICFKCQQWTRWHADSEDVNKQISFNLTWILPPYISRDHVISNFVVNLNINIVENSTIPVDNITVNFHELFQENSTTFTKNLDFTTRNVNMTFLNTLLFDNSWLYHLETQATWNSSSIPHQFMPPNHTYICTLYPTPGLVEDLVVTSCTTNGSYITLNLEWSPPSSAITVEIDSYDVCTGVSLESDLEMSPLNSGNRQQCSKFNFIKQINQTAIVYHPKTSTDLSEPLYVQIRARTLYTTGNWSELQYDLSMCHQEVDNSYIVGIIIGVSLISLVALICLGPSVCIIRMILRRRKLYRTMQGPHDPIFSGRVGRFQLGRSIITFPTRKPDKWEIPSKEIVVKELLGEGVFGEVYMGIIKCPIISPQRRASMHKSIFTSVAIKLLKPSSGGNERQDFLSEIEMMKKVAEGQNAHVVRLLGCVTIKEPLMLITEFVKYGDLLKYLRTNRRMCTGSNTEDDENDDAYVELGGVTSVDLISFAYQITSGMEYLSSLGIVHRDLACRNILVDEGKVLKITDFGLSRETDDIYIQKRTGRVPLKWMAIESIIAREFTSASDVWSFGVVLWEIGTLGGHPHPSIQNDQLLSMLNQGYRMEKPDNCSPEVYDIMLICWNEQPKERPTFKELRAKFDAMLLAEKNDTYIALCIDENKSYYQESQTPTATKDEDSDRKSACIHSTPNKRFAARKLADSRSGPSSVSLEEFRMVDRSQGMELRNPGNLPVSLSLQLITEDQKGQSDSRYVQSPMKGMLAATSPANTLVESKDKIEMESICEQNVNPSIEISFVEHPLKIKELT